MLSLSKQPLGIRGRLMLLAIAAILPLALDYVRNTDANRAESITAATRRASELAKSSADKQNEILANTRAFLQVVARWHTTFKGSDADCGQFLAHLVLDIPWARGIAIAGPSGRIVCAVNSEAIGLDISDRSHFQQAVNSGEFSVSDYAYGRRLPGPTLFAAFPQKAENGSVEAVVVIVIDLKWIKQAASAIEYQPGSVVLLVDGKGTIIARDPDTGSLVGQQFGDHPLVRHMLAHTEGTLTANGIDGVRRIFSFLKLPGTEARVAVGLDENRVMARVNYAMWTSYAQLSLIAGIVLVGIWFGGERFFVKPIHALAGAARRVGLGEPGTHTSGKRWAAEFVPLAAAIDDMANQIATREHALRATNHELEELAQNDGLTGLANRRTFDARLEKEWQHATKFGRPIALLMVDIDHFKLLNDHYGHLAGDACLQSLGKVFSDAVRKGSDLAARYGGEEFALLLPGAELKPAKNVAERLRKAVEQLCIAHAKAPVGHVTVSIGVTSIRPEPGIGAQTLIEAADANLYTAKRRGRNTLVAQPPIRPAAKSWAALAAFRPAAKQAD